MIEKSEERRKIMPRKPRAKNALSAGERAALYEAEQAQKRAKMISGKADGGSNPDYAEDGVVKTETAKAEKKKTELKKSRPFRAYGSN